MDRKINIAETTKINKPYQNKTILWSQLVERCRHTKHTKETLDEFLAMSKEEQGKIKDVGGFVGGYLRGGVRRKNSIELRDVLTLDADNGEENVWETFIQQESLRKASAFVYGTHKHTQGHPRLRLVVLLSRSVTPEEYEPIARYVAERCGIDAFDDTTYQPERVMFWPSTPTDQAYYFEYQEGEGEGLDPDKVLATYHNWRDCSEWARSSREDVLIREDHGNMGDPTQKDGVVGAFCRAYTISEAIDKFLPNIYRRCGAGRYTNVNCSCSGGLVVYDDKFAHSFNSTDPLTGKSVNAYDLVRIMLYGELDKDDDHFTKVNTLPSTNAMAQLLRDDEKVNVERFKEKGTETSESEAWRGKIRPSKNLAEPLSCQYNVRYILRNDPKLKGKIYKNDLTNEAYYSERLPWRNAGDTAGNWTSEDNSALREYLGIHYNQTNPNWIKDSFKVLLMENSVHPVRKYLDDLEWDGTERLDTLLIDYFGTEDSELVRMQTRIEFTAAVARVYEAGIKYDNMIILAGEEGCGKSTFLQKIAIRKEWFNDCVLGGLSSKEAIEGIRGRWIIEIGELAALKRNEVETVKNFLSRDEDKYRPAYAEQVERFPRQCVFFGTTNVVDCLRGTDGNRRMWIIKVKEHEPKKDIFTELDGEIDQIWAEAKMFYRKGQHLYLDKKLERAARDKQKRYNELAADPRIGWIREYLEKLLPDNWDEMNLNERKNYISGYPRTMNTAMTPFHHRERVCIMEIQQECLEDRLQNADEFSPKNVAKLLKWVEEWEYKGETHYKFSLYGLQRYYMFTGETDNIPQNRSENSSGMQDLPF